MVEIIRNVINAGNYKLSEIRAKIKRFYAMGDINEGELEELLSLATNGVKAENERPEVLAMLATLSERIAKLEEKVFSASDEATIEAWKPWDGISDKYQPGAVVTHQDFVWESIYNGQNVWEPGVPGTESMWIRKEA